MNSFFNIFRHLLEQINRGNRNEMMETYSQDLFSHLPSIRSRPSEFPDIEAWRMRHVYYEGIRKNVERIPLSKQFHYMGNFIPAEADESGIIQWYILFNHDVRLVIRLPSYLRGNILLKCRR